MREALLLGRVFFSLIFITAGFGHFRDSTIDFAASQGVPYAALLVPFSGLLAIAGGLSILLGYRAKIGAWMLTLFLIPVTIKMHAFWMLSDPIAAQIQQAMFMKNLSMLGGTLAFAYFGAGPYSLDSRISTDEKTALVGAKTSLAGTVIPASFQTPRDAFKANEASRITGIR